MFIVGDEVTVEGKTRKGKNRVQLYGNKWIVKEIHNNVVCVNGPGVQLSSVQEPDVWRWIAQENDQDFNVIDNPALVRRIV